MLNRLDCEAWPCGPDTFGTIAVQNVMFYEIAGPRMTGVILGLSFIVHQIGSAGGPMLASLAFDMTDSYDGFMIIMGLFSWPLRRSSIAQSQGSPLPQPSA